MTVLLSILLKSAYATLSQISFDSMISYHSFSMHVRYFNVVRDTIKLKHNRERTVMHEETKTLERF